MARVVVISNDPTVHCNIDWFYLECSFYASIFSPFCEQHGLETTLLGKIEGWNWAKTHAYLCKRKCMTSGTLA